jgi:hypothetical protein
MLCCGLPQTEYARFNETVGGMFQSLSSKITEDVEKKRIVLQVAEELGYRDIISSLINQNKN